MARKGSLGTWLKMLADACCGNRGTVCCVGGPALVYYVQPTDEELFKRYNPELQKKSLNRRYERQKEFDDFVTQLKTDSKDDRHIWTVQDEARRKYREERLREDAKNAAEAKARQETLRKESGL
ncbi:hypothetical protein PG985_012285 [Apiospora marii]|uniref:uncharacterized protein n=1 Tax=Apiospora marii TaxID=335849 RepID=UPI00312D72ED